MACLASPSHEADFLFARGSYEVNEGFGFWKHNRGRGRVASSVPFAGNLYDGVTPDKLRSQSKLMLRGKWNGRKCPL